MLMMMIKMMITVMMMRTLVVAVHSFIVVGICLILKLEFGVFVIVGVAIPGIITIHVTIKHKSIIISSIITNHKISVNNTHRGCIGR